MNWKRLIIGCALVSFLGLWAEGVDARSDPTELVRSLRQGPASAGSLERMMDEVRTTLDRAPATSELFVGVLSDPEAPDAIRLALADTLIKVDQEATLRAVLAAAAADLAKVEQGGDADRHARWRVDCVLHGLVAHPRLGAMEGDENLLALLDWGSRHGYEPVGRESARFELLFRAPLDAGTRSRLLCNAILTQGPGAVVDCRMPLEMLREADRERLREPLRAWSGELATYPQYPVWALVLLGDKPTLELLRSWRGADRVDERLRRGFRDLVALGEGRNEPAAALRFIESGGLLSSSNPGTCALESAVRLGAGREAVRAALFERERRVTAAVAELAKTERARKGLRRSCLWPMKETAVRLGVLTPDEWPDVTAPPSDTGVTP